MCADGEWHVLPARILAEQIAPVARVTFVGGSVPPHHLEGYLPRVGVDAVAISCTVPSNLAGAARTVAAVHTLGLPALVGGAAFGPDARRADAIGADAWAPTAAAAREVLAGWATGDRPGGVVTPALDRTTEARVRGLTPAIVDEAFALLAERFPPLAAYDEDAVARTREDLTYQLEFLAAAVLVDDERIFLEMVPWLTDLLVARGVPPQAVVAGLRVLDERLTAHGLEAPARIVRRAGEFVPGT